MVESVGIVTDSTAYLTEELLKEYSITVVPLIVNYKDINFREGEQDNAEFYTRLRKSNVLPTTSQPALGEFVEAYKNLEDKYSSIISIHISGKLSGTVIAAETARKMLSHMDIEIFDSLSTATGLGFQVLEACRAAQLGKSKQEIMKRLNWMRNNIKVFFMVGSLEYLHRGGRIGGASTLLGTFLEIKPILHLCEGRIEVLERVRTKPRAIKRMLEIMKQDVIDKGLGGVAVAHVDAPKEGKKLAEYVKKECRHSGLMIPVFEIGPVIGLHVGPDALGIIYYPSISENL